MRIRYVGLFVLSATLAGCATQVTREGTNPNVQAANEDRTEIVTAEQIIINRVKLGIQSVKIETDPLYQRPMAYSAVLLKTVFDNLTMSGPKGMSSREFVFVCSDGYRAVLRGEDAVNDTGFLAFGAGGGFEGATNWPTVMTPKGIASAAPLYLVWTNAAADKRPWPYMIRQIEVRPAGEFLAKANPEQASKGAREGFRLFQLNCGGCHSMNGAGGGIGVELNYPMNVTEYWKEKALKRLISNPATVRANAKMPAFPHLTAREIDSIIEYLRTMRGYKMAVPPAATVID